LVFFYFFFNFFFFFFFFHGPAGATAPAGPKASPPLVTPISKSVPAQPLENGCFVEQG
jgi:hypothetical protein